MLHRQALRGKRILVVEDEWAQAAVMRDVLEDAGAVVVGLAADSRQACNLLDGTAADAAVVDLHLDGGTGHMLAHLLDMRGIPYLIATGYVPEATKAHPGVIVLPKPFRGEELVWAVESLLDGRAQQWRVEAFSKNPEI
jgi:CheY-like chemotaxis protein